MNLRYALPVFALGNRLFDLTLAVDFTCSPGDPGNTYGPPEHCHPPEGGAVEDWTVAVVQADYTDPDGTPHVWGCADTLRPLTEAVNARLAADDELREALEAACVLAAAEADTYEPDW